MDDLPKNMTNVGAAASAFDMGNRHVPMLPKQGATSAAADAIYAPAINWDKFAATGGRST
jgi:urease accessory protein UreE